ncbi:MAG: hypothetical protein ABWX68_09495 [Arthrobacter sp.]|uniref:hypothetical protein n=1 Tax=Arthrobacter sp. TaxID=1667 RepID=UPI00349A7632
MRITVTVDAAHADRTAEVADQLRGAGMRVDRVLGALGLVTGEVDAEHRQGLAAVEGVAGVDDQLDVTIAPPESGLQ